MVGRVFMDDVDFRRTGGHAGGFHGVESLLPCMSQELSFLHLLTGPQVMFCLSTGSIVTLRVC